MIIGKLLRCEDVKAE